MVNTTLWGIFHCFIGAQMPLTNVTTSKLMSTCLTSCHDCVLMVQQIVVFNAVWTSSALGFKLWCGGEKKRQLPVMSAYDSKTMQQASEEDKNRKIWALLCRCFLWLVWSGFWRKERRHYNRIGNIDFNNKQTFSQRWAYKITLPQVSIQLVFICLL